MLPRPEFAFSKAGYNHSSIMIGLPPENFLHFLVNVAFQFSQQFPFRRIEYQQITEIAEAYHIAGEIFFHENEVYFNVIGLSNITRSSSKGFFQSNVNMFISAIGRTFDVDPMYLRIHYQKPGSPLPITLDVYHHFKDPDFESPVAQDPLISENQDFSADDDPRKRDDQY